MSFSAALAGQVETKPEQAFMVVEKGLVTASIQNRPLSVVLDQLVPGRQVTITVSPEIGAESVAAELKRVPLEEALRRVLSKYDAFYYYAATGDNAPSLRAIWVYAKGTASALKPVPPEAWASQRDLLTSIEDRDPVVRERAYEALILRPDTRSRELVIAALRGFREKDEGMRQRLLSRAVSNGMPMPEEVLADLARADSSEQIRLIALDALARDSAVVKAVAEAALSDASDSVRARAKDILSELDGIAQRKAGRRQPEVQP
jgi:hypothetical protein